MISSYDLSKRIVGAAFLTTLLAAPLVSAAPATDLAERAEPKTIKLESFMCREIDQGVPATSLCHTVNQGGVEYALPPLADCHAVAGRMAAKQGAWTFYTDGGTTEQDTSSKCQVQIKNTNDDLRPGGKTRINFDPQMLADFVNKWSDACFGPGGKGKFNAIHCSITSPEVFLYIQNPDLKAAA